MAPHTDDIADDVGAALIQQLRAAGATVNPALNFFAPEPEPEIEPTQQGGAAAAAAAPARERRVVARGPIQRGDVLLFLPPGTYLAPPARGEAAARHSASQLYRGCPREAARLIEQQTPSNQPLTGFAAATLQLCHLSCTGAGPRWFEPYFSLLPVNAGDDRAGDYPCPPCWSSEHLALLEGTTVDRSVVECVERTRLGLADWRSRSRAAADGLEPGGSCCSAALLEFWSHHVDPLKQSHPDESVHMQSAVTRDVWLYFDKVLVITDSRRRSLP